MSPRPPLPQRTRKSPVSTSVHVTEAMYRKYRVLAERLREHLDGPERDSLDIEMDLTHLEVTESLREIGKETYGGDGK